MAQIRRRDKEIDNFQDKQVKKINQQIKLNDKLRNKSTELDKDD